MFLGPMNTVLQFVLTQLGSCGYSTRISFRRYLPTYSAAYVPCFMRDPAMLIKKNWIPLTSSGTSHMRKKQSVNY